MSDLTTVTKLIDAPASDVFEELSDGWGYASWVVGASHIRAVDDGWPERGSAIHHKVGAWPVTFSDRTISLDCESDRKLVLSARAWPIGVARVQLELTPQGPGRTLVAISEGPVSGIAQKLDNPVMRWLLALRNRESLDRLSDRAVNRQRRLRA